MFSDGVIESSSTTGTGSYTLTGAVFSGLTFAQGFPLGGPVAYFAQTADKSKWEMGTGTLTVGPPRILTRATILKSSNAGSAIDWQGADVYYVYSIASADALAGLVSGNLADTTRPWWVRAGGRWWNYAAGLAVSWIDNLYSGSADVRKGIFDVVKGLYFPDNRRSSTAVGAANKVFAAADIGGSFTFSTSGGARTATLPAGSTVKDGYHLEMKGLSTANGIVLTPDAGDGIDGGADGATKTIPGGVVFTVRWSNADDQWLTDYITPAAAVYPAGTISGLTYQNNASDATNDIDVASGGCMSDDGTTWITIAATTKQLDVAAAADNGATPSGMLGPAAAIGNNDYLLYAINNPTTGESRVFAEKADTVPTLPSGFTKKRAFGWIKRSGAAIVAFKTYERDGGGLEFKWSAPTIDIALANTLTTTRRTDAVKVPLVFSVIALLRLFLSDASTAFNAVICCPDETDGAPSASAAPLVTVSATTVTPAATEAAIRTSATGTIAARADLASVDVYRVATVGFTWSRR